MTASLPITSYAEAAGHALVAFGIQADEVHAISNSENLVFRVFEAATGRELALSLHRPGYHNAAALESQRLWTDALHQSGLTVPLGIRSRNGHWFASVPTPDPQRRRFAGITEWIDGHMLEDLLEEDENLSPACYHKIGELLAKMHNQSDSWSIPLGFERHHLDVEGLMGDSSFWGRFWESGLLCQQEKALTGQVRTRLIHYLEQLAETNAGFGIIHADAHPGNVLVNGKHYGLIDFDDMAFGWYAYDMAVSLYGQWNNPDFPKIRDTLFNGYQQHRPLPTEIDLHLSRFLLIRALILVSWRETRVVDNGTAAVSLWKPKLMAECREFLAGAI